MRAEKAARAQIDDLEHRIAEIRGQKVMSANRTHSSCGGFDPDLASIYGVTTARLNQEVERDQEHFPSDFVFRVTSAGTRL